MSSILRALKKLENEPRHLEENQPLDSKFVPLADTEQQRPISTIFMMVVGGGIVCGLVILAGWWLFSEKGQPPPAVTREISRPGSRLDKSPGPTLDLNKTTDSEKPASIKVFERQLLSCSNASKVLALVTLKVSVPVP